MDTESQRLLVLHRKRWKDGKQCDGRRLLDQQLRHLSKSYLSRINKRKGTERSVPHYGEEVERWNLHR